MTDGNRAESRETTNRPSTTILRKGGIRQRMKCSANIASIIEETFVTAEQLLDAVESNEPLTDTDGIGPKTAERIEDWYENREEREANVRSATTRRTSGSSWSITFHTSWEEALGMEGNDAE